MPSRARRMRGGRSDRESMGSFTEASNGGGLRVRPRRGRSSRKAKMLTVAAPAAMAMTNSRTRYTHGSLEGTPTTLPTMSAMAPPRSAAPTLVTGITADWSEKSSLRFSARLCSMRNGDWSTKKVWLPAPIAAARARIASGEVTTMRPAIANVEPAAPSARTMRRPSRSDRMLAGKATSTPAAEPTVPLMPMNAGSKPSAMR